MKLGLSEKGHRYLTKLVSENSEDQEKKWEMGIMAYLSQESIDDFDIEAKAGSIGKSIVRRLFEEGYIKEV